MADELRKTGGSPWVGAAGSVKAVFFDLGGTLWAPFGDLAWDPVIRSAALAAARKAAPEELAPRLASALSLRLAAFGGARERAIEVSFADPAFREEDLTALVADALGILTVEVTREQLSDIARQLGDELTRHHRLFPDTVPALRALRAARPDVTLAIVSNTIIQPDIIDFYLAGCGLDRLVGFRVLSSEVGWRKPHPAIYAAALAEAGVRPEEALFVGDRPVEDVAGPKRLGMRAILCRFDGDAEALPSWATPDAVVPDLSSLPRLLGEPEV